MQATTTTTTIEAIYTFTDADQHFQTFTFDSEPSEAEMIAKMLSALAPDQLRALVKISICQYHSGAPLPWLDSGKYYFRTI
jgi:hypothetical protein